MPARAGLAGNVPAIEHGLADVERSAVRVVAARQRVGRRGCIAEALRDQREFPRQHLIAGGYLLRASVGDIAAPETWPDFAQLIPIAVQVCPAGIQRRSSAAVRTERQRVAGHRVAAPVGPRAHERLVGFEKDLLTAKADVAGLPAAARLTNLKATLIIGAA